MTIYIISKIKAETMLRGLEEQILNISISLKNYNLNMGNGIITKN